MDCKLVCEVPRVGPRRTEMASCLSDAVGAPVTVSGRSPEGLGVLGRREGIVCWAVAVVTAP